jgi:hypothetical protein
VVFQICREHFEKARSHRAARSGRNPGDSREMVADVGLDALLKGAHRNPPRFKPASGMAAPPFHPRILTRPMKAVNPQNVAGPSTQNPSLFRFAYFLERT